VAWASPVPTSLSCWCAAGLQWVQHRADSLMIIGDRDGCWSLLTMMMTMVIKPVPDIDDIDQCHGCDSGGITDRRPRWHTTDAVPVGSPGDIEDHPGAGGRWTVSTAAVRHTHKAPQSGGNDSASKALDQFARYSRVCHCGGIATFCLWWPHWGECVVCKLMLAVEGLKNFAAVFNVPEIYWKKNTNSCHSWMEC